jgi:hypothetical protein
MEIIAVLAAIVALYLVYKVLFGDLDELIDAFKYWFTPDIFSWFSGEGFDDFVAEIKLAIWIISGVGTYIGVMALSNA